MNLNENLLRIKEVMGILNEQPSDEVENKDTVNLVGKVLDLENMTQEEKKEFQLKEKIVIDNKLKEYPIVLVQTRDGKIIMFDVEGNIENTNEKIFD